MWLYSLKGDNLIIDDSAKAEIIPAWEKCKQTEKYGIEFGKICFKWREKLIYDDSLYRVEDLWKELNIPEGSGRRWLSAYMKSEDIKLVKIEKRTNRSEPPDDFEVLRKLAKKMLNIGFKTLKETNIDPSHLSAAKTWANCRIEEKEYKK